ncbi:uncharacterized protein QC763_206740 [Podospora pseudopauciseta]|uniref:Uncharacterized protein n=2 Tax=Podospora TaxID=5144 RepID=A0ABR0HP56_9PEZI|nr:hypothetical protein QC763_206740 [Podospora pseudopauciseta]KAK4679732.1 hypothetical protein QC764_206740 [Podospora pseudoanserina]
MGAAAYGGPFSIPDEGHFGGHVLAIEEEAKKVLYLAIFPLHFRKHLFLALCHVPMSGLQMLSSASLDIGITSHKNALEPRPAPLHLFHMATLRKVSPHGYLDPSRPTSRPFSLSSFPSTCRYRTCKM